MTSPMQCGLDAKRSKRLTFTQTLHGTGIFTYIGVVWGVNVGIYGIHGVSGLKSFKQ